MFKPRLSTEKLAAIHGTAAAAFAAADFFSAIRLAGGDPVVTGASLAMLGHERRGVALLDGEHALPRTGELVRALGLWLSGVSDGDASALARDLAGREPAFGPAAALVAAMANPRPHIVYYCTAANTLRATDLLKAHDHAAITVLRNVPAKADVAFGPGTPARQLAAAIREPVSCVLVDNLLMLPSQLAAIDAPKIAQVADIEFSYAQRGRELGWLDLVVSIGNSEEHMCARARFGDHVVLRAIPLDEFAHLEVSADLIRSRADPRGRTIDALVTGGIDKPFYPDKQQRYAALAQAGSDLDIRLLARYLPYERYQALTRAAKYSVLSNRMAQIVTLRAIETLTAGTMLACEPDQALHLLFGDGLAGVHSYRDGAIARDIARLVADYPRHHADFLRSIPVLVEAIPSLYPKPVDATRRFVRYLGFWAEMARRGLGWRHVVADAPTTGRRSISMPTAQDCYAAKHEPWLGLPPALRGRLLAPLAAVSDDALRMPRLGQTVTAQAFLAVNDLDDDLYRHQAEGTLRARLTILRSLNRARRLAPRSLATWFLIGKHLAEVGRRAAAARMLSRLTWRADTLELEQRVTIVDGSYEVNDWPFVDAVARDALAQAHPSALGPSRDLARAWIVGRAHALLAAICAIDGDTPAFHAHAASARQLAGGDPGVLDHLLASGVQGWLITGDRLCLVRALQVYATASRLSPRVLFDQFATAVEIARLLGREALADLVVRRWLRAKSRLRLDAEQPVITDGERALFGADPALFHRNAATFAGTALGAVIASIEEGLRLSPPARIRGQRKAVA